MLIAVGHKARHGKDTMCETLKEKYGGTILKFADPLYTLANFVQDWNHEEQRKDPKLLQSLGEYCRNKFGENFFVNLLIEKVKRTEGNIFISDLRYPNEMKAINNLGGITVKVFRPNAPIDRDPNHPSEIGLNDAEFDVEILNSGTLDEFKEKILKTDWDLVYNINIEQ